ncbi:hypothetical protein [Streptomyces sp. NPDC051546]|uniref:hypothetical protein n=1 Tax=Streptomyces sp. NPDC051546 TaxID=3365655 RepID=UPI0037958F3D
MTPQQETVREGSKRGGLPEGDADLAALASGALGPTRSSTKAAPAGPPQPAGTATTIEQGSPSPQPAAAPPQPRASTSEPAAPPRHSDEPVDTSASDNRFTQVTSIVDVEVLERFNAYKLDQKIRGSEPSNTVVVFQAINQAVAQSKLEELSKVAVEGQEEAGGFLSIQAPGRRTSRERRRTDQLSWRPTFANLEQIDDLWPTAGFKDRSHFVNGVLESFLPDLKRKRAKRR